MQRLLLISNRLPVTFEKRKGTFSCRQSVGGLATGLGAFYKNYNSIWIGWSGLTSNTINRRGKKNIEEQLLKEYNSYSVFLSKRDVRLFYTGFCNKTIWPLFHYFSDYANYSQELWESYKHVNRLFAQTIKKMARSDDIIWIHDYHLMLLPQMLREILPNTHIGFFLHIPFPSYEIFRLLPWRNEILKGLLGSDLIGFHTYDYVRHFTSSVRRILGYEHTYGKITLEHRIVKVDAFPMGIQYDRWANAQSDPIWIENIHSNCRVDQNTKIILSVDRLDYTKGITQRLEAFDYFLDKHPGYKQRVVLLLIAVPSRTNVETYRILKQQVDQLVGRINGKHGTMDWMPVWYFNRFMPFNHLSAFYEIADVALITPLRDGMNLIAKEYVATKKDNKGVLILSEMAGAVSELSEAVIVNPNNKEEMADAIQEALVMTVEDQRQKMQIMKKRIQSYNVITWAEDFMDRLSHAKTLQLELKAKKLTRILQKRLLKEYLKSKNRLIFLDYDGTLVPYATKSDKASPDDEIYKLLSLISAESKNEVVIVSGRSREILTRWFGKYNIGISAEHGVWIKERKGKWHMLEPLQDHWKSEVFPIMETFVNRTPGSYIEEKSFSLVWHYQKTDLELGPLRANELKDTLMGLTANFNLVVLEGSRVIEVKNAGINKGRAALFWTSNKIYDFILAIGDDWTDEDLFEMLPASAFSIKVGIDVSNARYSVNNHWEVRELLHMLKNETLST